MRSPPPLDWDRPTLAALCERSMECMDPDVAGRAASQASTGALEAGLLLPACMTVSDVRPTLCLHYARCEAVPQRSQQRLLHDSAMPVAHRDLPVILGWPVTARPQR